MYRFEYIDNQPCTDWTKIYAEMAKKVKGYVTIQTEQAYISTQQRRWWKGVYLPSLSKDNGESVLEWETRLKLKIMPDKFRPQGMICGKTAYNVIPSITILSNKDMNYMIKESVLWLREGEDGPHLDWVTEPDSSLRKLIGL